MSKLPPRPEGFTQKAIKNVTIRDREYVIYSPGSGGSYVGYSDWFMGDGRNIPFTPRNSDIVFTKEPGYSANTES